MKHNTHIYIALKAIEFLLESCDNLHTMSNRKASSKSSSLIKRNAKELQRLLLYHKDQIDEASWAPDDVLNDKALFHTFKLFTTDEFNDVENHFNDQFEHNGKTYYKITKGGGLPYKVDHLARMIADIVKLRNYNDHFTQKESFYLYLLISHYIVDAHVPMHCDVRDDPPSSKDTSKPRNGSYLKSSVHGKIEKIWEDAVMPVAIEEEIIQPVREKDFKEKSDLSEDVVFDLNNKDHTRFIKPVIIGNTSIMQFMIQVCIATKERSLKLFPLDEPNNWKKETLKSMTREIYADAIANLISVWLWMWTR